MKTSFVQTKWWQSLTRIQRFYMVILGIILFIGLYNLLLVIFDYPLSSSPEEVATWIVQTGKDPSICLRINALDYFPMPVPRPTDSTLRRTCIYLVAEKEKNPVACKLLMPSSYGWNCLEGATDNEPCVFLANPEKTIKGNNLNTTLEQCISGPNTINNNECCIIARITFQEKNQESCNSVIKSSALNDQCHHEVAIRDKNLSECTKMKNLRNETACEVGVKALLAR